MRNNQSPATCFRNSRRNSIRRASQGQWPDGQTGLLKNGGIERGRLYYEAVDISQQAGPRWHDHSLSRAKTAAWLRKTYRTITIMPAVFAENLPPLLSSKLSTLQIEVGIKCPCLSSIPRRKVTIILWLSTMILRRRLIIRLPSC